MRALPLLGLVLLAPAASAAPPVLEAQKAAKPDAVAAATLRALANQDDAVLAEVAHRKKGVRFSTYGNVAASDVRLWRAGLRGAFKNKKLWTWGEFDGSGDPMTLTFSGFRDFLWKCDYTQTKDIRKNPKEPADESGNQGGNAASAYPKAQVVQYYCPTDETRMWSSLSIAFERQGGRWYLVGVIDDGWTI